MECASTQTHTHTHTNTQSVVIEENTCVSKTNLIEIAEESDHVKIHIGEGKGNPLKYSCLENSMDRDCQELSMGVTKSQTRLST